jgi:hypothetical protein
MYNATAESSRAQAKEELLTRPRTVWPLDNFSALLFIMFMRLRHFIIEIDDWVV